MEAKKASEAARLKLDMARTIETVAAAAGVKESAMRSQEAQKEAARAAERLHGKSAKERQELATSLDGRKDTYLELLAQRRPAGRAWRA